MSRVPFVVNAEQQPALKVVGERIRVLAEGEQTGSYEVFLQSGPEGAGPPPHMHPWDEAYFVLEGAIEVLLGDRTVTARPGEFVHIPAQTVHCFRMVTPQARFLSITSARGAARFFADLDREVDAQRPDLPTMLAVAARNQVRVPPPPGAGPG